MANHLFLLLLLAIPTLVLSECCYKTLVKFYVNKNTNEPCRYFENGSNNYRKKGAAGVSDLLQNRCKASVCGNGRHMGGTYCGVGPCNIFGCNCDGGCIRGNAVEEFRRKYNDKVHGVSQDMTDKLHDEILNLK